MDIVIKESVYVKDNAQTYLVRSGTRGIEKDNILWFLDITGSHSIGFVKDTCTALPQIFSVTKTPADREVSIKQVLRAISECPLERDVQECLITKIQEL